MAGICQQLSQLIRLADYFGPDVTLTYKGSPKYKTIFGGCITLLIFLVVAAQALYSLHELITNP